MLPEAKRLLSVSRQGTRRKRREDEAMILNRRGNLMALYDSDVRRFSRACLLIRHRHAHRTAGQRSAAKETDQ